MCCLVAISPKAREISDMVVAADALREEVEAAEVEIQSLEREMLMQINSIRQEYARKIRPLRNQQINALNSYDTLKALLSSLLP